MAYIVKKRTTCDTCDNPNCEHGDYFILRDSNGDYLESLGREGSIKKSKIDEVVNKGLVSRDEVNDKIPNRDPVIDEPEFSNYTSEDVYSIRDMLYNNVDTELYEPYDITVRDHTEYEGNNNHISIYVRGCKEVDELNKISISDSSSLDYFKVDTDEKKDIGSEDDEERLKIIFNEVTDTLKKNYEYVQEKKEEYNIDNVDDIIWSYGSVENMKDYKRYEVKNNVDNIDTELLDELNITNDDIEYDYSFDKIPRLNYKAKRKLEDKFGDLKNISEDNREEIQDINGIGKSTADKIIKWGNKVDDISDKEVDDNKTIKASNLFKQESLDKNVVDVIKESNRVKKSGGIHDWKDNGEKIIKLNKDNVKNGMVMDPNDTRTRSFVLAHEIGHAIESDSYSDDNSEYKRETGDFIKNMSEEAKFETQFLHRFVVGDSRNDPQERFANLVGMLTTEPKRTKKIAPNAVDAVEKLSNQMDGESGNLLQKVINEDYYN